MRGGQSQYAHAAVKWKWLTFASIAGSLPEQGLACIIPSKLTEERLASINPLKAGPKLNLVTLHDLMLDESFIPGAVPTPDVIQMEDLILELPPLSLKPLVQDSTSMTQPPLLTPPAELSCASQWDFSPHKYPSTPSKSVSTAAPAPTQPEHRPLHFRWTLAILPFLDLH